MEFSRASCIVFAILSSVLSSTSSLVKAQALKVLSPMITAPIGVLFGGSLTFLYLICVRQVPKIADIKPVLRPLLMLSLCRSITANTLFTIGLSMTSGVEAVFLTKMEPYLVIFWVWVLDHKRPDNRHLSLLLIHILGAVLLSAGDSLDSGSIAWGGDLIIILGVIASALSYRFAPLVTRSLKPLQVASLTEMIGGVVTLPFILFATTYGFGPEEQRAWLYVAIHSIMFYIFAVSLLYASLRGIEGWLSSALRAIGPLAAAPMALFLFGETLNAVQWGGALIVLVTSALISRGEKRKGVVVAEVVTT